MLNIILSLCFLCLGIYGVIANWWAVVDLIRVVVPVLLVVIGVLGVVAGVTGKGAARARLRKQ
jgi:hypothetical protein